MDKKIDIDFYEFFKTGKFAGLKLGLTKVQVLENFPVPDGYTSLDYANNETFDIWRYGNIELHFDNNNLYLIYSDYIDNLDGGESLTLKKWILEQSENLTLLKVITEFNQELIDFKKVSLPEYQCVKLFIEKSKVELTFLDSAASYDSHQFHIKNVNALKLNSFALVNKFVW